MTTRRQFCSRARNPPNYSLYAGSTSEYARGYSYGEMAELVEGAPLLREYGVKSSIEGSNPSLSASHSKSRPQVGFFNDSQKRIRTRIIKIESRSAGSTSAARAHGRA
jgi:hypothetical protein